MVQSGRSTVLADKRRLLPSDFHHASGVFRTHADSELELPEFLRDALQVWDVPYRRFSNLHRVTALGFDARACLIDQIEPPVTAIQTPSPLMLCLLFDLPENERVAVDQLFDEDDIHARQWMASVVASAQRSRPSKSSAIR